MNTVIIYVPPRLFSKRSMAKSSKCSLKCMVDEQGFATGREKNASALKGLHHKFSKNFYIYFFRNIRFFFFQVENENEAIIQPAHPEIPPLFCARGTSENIIYLPGSICIWVNLHARRYLRLNYANECKNGRIYFECCGAPVME